MWLANEDAIARIEADSTGGYSDVFQPAGSAGNTEPLLKGRRDITVEQAPALGTPGDIVLADLSQYAIFAKPPASAVSVHVAFLSDQVVFRFVLRVDGKAKWSSAVTPFNATSTRSPFIVTAQRLKFRARGLARHA